MNQNNPSRFWQYLNRHFHKRLDKIDTCVSKDEMFPKTIASCFKRLSLNPDIAVDNIDYLISEAPKDINSWHSLLRMLIVVGYALGKHSRKKKLETLRTKYKSLKKKYKVLKHRRRQ